MRSRPQREARGQPDRATLNAHAGELASVALIPVSTRLAAIEALGAEHGFDVDATEDAARFTDAALSRYKVVVFLSTTGDVLDAAQKTAFERYIRSGGGFVGIHSASDTEYEWPWYGRLVESRVRKPRCASMVLTL